MKRPKKIKQSHPQDELIRTDRIPHIWCSGCGIGTVFNCVISGIRKSGYPLKDVAMVSGIGLMIMAVRYRLHMNQTFPKQLSRLPRFRVLSSGQTMLTSSVFSHPILSRLRSILLRSAQISTSWQKSLTHQGPCFSRAIPLILWQPPSRRRWRLATTT